MANSEENKEAHRQPVHLGIRKTDLERMDKIATRLDLVRADVIRLAIIEYIERHL